MAKITSPITFSGKLGNVVGVRYPGGVALRTRVTPTNPRSSRQQAHRSLYTQFTKKWNSLGGTNQDSWSLWGRLVNLRPMGTTNLPGNRNFTGNTLYTSTSIALVETAQNPLETAPPGTNYQAFLISSFGVPTQSAPGSDVVEIPITFENNDLAFTNYGGIKLKWAFASQARAPENCIWQESDAYSFTGLEVSPMSIDLDTTITGSLMPCTIYVQFIAVDQAGLSAGISTIYTITLAP